MLYTAIALFAVGCKNLPKEGKNFFEKAHYESAIPIYKSILGISTATDDQKREASYMLAECYRLSNRVKESVPYYKMAIDLGQVKGDPLFYYAQALKAQGKYEEAAKAFEQFYQGGGSETLVSLAKREKEYLPKIKEAVTTKSFTTIANCEGINTPTGDYAPSILQKKVVFTSARRNEKVFLTNGLGFNDLYVFNMKDSAKCEGEIIPFFNQNINAYGSHEASSTFSPDGKTMIFARSNKGEKKEILKQVKLFKSTFDGTQWTEPSILSPVSTDTLDVWDSNPALSPDGKTLYFTSNRRNDTYGSTDLFRATKEANGGWGNIENLGKPFNTEGREDFPYVAPDGRFFFASESHGSLGGLDIFVVDTVKVMDETTKKEKIELKVRNVGVPMNSTADDFAIAFTNKTDGYFSSNRTTDGAKGDDDIYAFRNDSIYQKTVKYYLQGITYKKDLKGVETILGGVKVDIKNDKNEVIESSVSDTEGKFKFAKPVLIDKNYMVFATKGKEYLDDDTLFTTVGKGVKDITKLPKKDNIIWFDTKLSLRENFLAEKKDEKGKIIIPEITILYDYDKANIRPDAAAILDEFYAFLKDYFAEYPDQVLEMGSHTDSRGNDKYNQKLAQRRADSAVAYLIAKGVSAERIKAKGYGESEPKIKNAKTEPEHQQNRRTTVKIIKK